MKKYFIVLVVLVGFARLNVQAADDVLNKIRGINLPGVTITAVEEVPAGNFTTPDGKKRTNLPAFIRVAFTSKPTSQSNIRIELWMPKDTWNERFLGTGTGGGAGYISYDALIGGITQGFATAYTDMGTSPGADKIIDYPERWADFGYRATHMMTVLSKAILNVYYERPAKYSYFEGCSTGGEQALMEAQRYPDDYNGIVVGAPANNRTHLHTLFVHILNVINPDHQKAVISQSKMELLSRLLVQKYGIKSGGAPGDDFLTDPRLCHFDAESLPVCTDESNNDSCFSAAEIAVLKKLYEGPVNPRTGNRIYAPLPLGGTRIVSVLPHIYMFKWVFGKDFDYAKFDFDHDMQKMDSILGPVLNANNPDLSAMKKRGGKILMFTGTTDQLVPAPDAINYYERVIKAQGGLKQTQSFFRFYLIPGMAHCGGGPGITEFGHKLNTMMDWVEKGIAPDKIVVTALNCCDTINRIRFNRPIYPYPKFPDYLGGDPNLPSSYTGKNHPRGAVLKPDELYLK